MYNLLVIGSGESDAWEQSQGEMFDLSRSILGRVFEHTQTSIRERFTRSDGLPDYEALTKLPCLFTYEGTEVTGSLGWISEVVSADVHLRIVYSLPDAYPRLRMNEVSVFERLGIEPREKGRNHWAVKDVDLFEVAFRVLYRQEK